MSADDPLNDIFGDATPSDPKRRRRREKPSERTAPRAAEPVQETQVFRPGPPLPAFEELDQMDEPDYNPFGGSPDEESFRHRAERRVREREPEPLLDITKAEISAEVLMEIEGSDARMLSVIPISATAGSVTLACADPTDVDLMEKLRPIIVGKRISLVRAESRLIHRRIDKEYSAQHEAAKVAMEMQAADGVATERHETGMDLGNVGSGEGANNRLLRLIIEQAIREGASDVHMEPVSGGFEVRMRVDGKLHLRGAYGRDVESGLTTLVKVEAKMATDNKHRPDSGVLVFQPKGYPKAVDIRVETTPCAWGQAVVMRLQNEVWRDLSTLGFSPENEKRFRAAIAAPYGVLLATGPTGSGKTTTLYSALRERIDVENKIITLENPIEYKIPSGVTQIAVNEAQNMTFARGLRSILRQDPDIVLVGEIRDGETAETAVDAAMTGHLVLSTLHTNDAVGALPRMARLGIEPFLLSSSVLGVVGQRLVRKLCEHCKVAVQEVISGEQHDVFTNNPDGCSECFTGYSGRVPIHEVLTVTPDMRDLIADNAAQSVLQRAAREAGMTTMREDGLFKVTQGTTSVHEVMSSTRE